MGSRKKARLSLWYGVVPVLLCAVAAAALTAGLVNLRASRQAQDLLRGTGRDVELILPRIRGETADLAANRPEASMSGLQEWIDECDEEMQRARKQFKHLLADYPERAEMTEQWDKIVARSKRVATIEAGTPGSPPEQDSQHSILQKMLVDLETFEREFSEGCDMVAEVGGHKRRLGLLFIQSALGAVVLAGLWCAVSLAWGALEAASPAGEDVDLASELDMFSRRPKFRARIKHLRPAGAPPLPSDARWELKLVRVAGERRTHICFEAVACCGEEQIPVWGRRYKWAGYVKGLQHVLFPAFQNANWRIMCTLRANGLPGPFPLAHVTRREGPLSRGGIVLCEHLGTLEYVKRFFREECCLLPSEGRRELARRLISFLDGLHGAGLYRISTRYLHGRNLSDPTGKSELFLLDLDKVLLWERCPRRVARWLRRADGRRLSRMLSEALTAEEYAEAQQYMRRVEEDAASRTRVPGPLPGEGDGN